LKVLAYSFSQKNFQMKLIFKSVIILFILFEIVFTFKRHFYFPVDGDLPAIVLPDKSYQAVLKDPFGMNVLLHDSIYSAPNRFFTHWSMWIYFNHVPQALQAFTSPVNSIYYSCTLAKTLIQFFIIFLFAVYMTGKKNIFHFDNLLAVSLIIPFFQIFGYNIAMGIIDHSISYTFFYAYALSFIILFFLPYYLMWFYDKPIDRYNIILLILLSVWLSLNGPLDAPLILIICPIILVISFFSESKLRKNQNGSFHPGEIIKRIPYDVSLVFSFAILCCLYSFYLGKNNSENLWATIPLLERYARLPYGLYQQFTIKLGPPLLLFMCLVNAWIVKIKFKDSQAKKLLKMLKWFGIMSVIYILLLPLGGYRSYRPYIIRMDTIMPVILFMILYYGITTMFILKQTAFNGKKIYIAAVTALALIFLNADSSMHKYNVCERKSLDAFSASTEKVVLLNAECSVLSWEKISDPQVSETRTELLYRWNVTKEKKLFYQK